MGFLFSKFPNLSRPVKRDIKWPWLGPVAYTVGALAFIILIVLNTALTAYDTVITKTSDFNATQSHWYNRFSGPEKPGTLCDSYNFTVGETFSTTNLLFEYTVLSVGANQTTLPYSGTGLDSCDILNISIDADSLAYTGTAVAYFACKSPDFPLIAKTTFTGSRHLTKSTRAEAFITQYSEDRFNSVNVVYMMELAITDVLNQMINVGPSSAALPSALSTWAIPNCSKVSAQNYTSIMPNCTTGNNSPPTWIFDFYYGFMALPNGSEVQEVAASNTPSIGTNYVSYNWVYSPNITALYLPALLNVAQLYAAAVRLDIGQIQPNNVILYNNTRSSSLNANFPAAAGGTAYASQLLPSSWFVWPSAIPKPGAFINAQYLCRFAFPQSWGKALINVLVATFSLFSAGWGLALMLFAWLAVKKEEDHYCNGCLERTSNSHASAVNTPHMEKDPMAYSV
ncbi:hypothetical protein BOTBODRAFT_487489 [Botryobasidium botryosum FD-172 SS1]|uniref:Transmembrane protein n=1 Tax=Botryobasidium botryosum (strain FD-172 SS1) TaxID=930990 RepID=A0A067M4G8_BOTB1|nr:hypothetical protein BOTBODRAFT_487489 [Botryobasidium botryosum FD-172 SS1]